MSEQGTARKNVYKTNSQDASIIQEAKGDEIVELPDKMSARAKNKDKDWDSQDENEE